jgi:hypothetical protein
MTDTTLELQQEIFNQPLEGAELQAVNALVTQHKGNAALTQQLALDASRLITTSQERLAKQSGSGFFKRFASKISGKNSENQLQNQVDMLQMQRFAWHYLKQLQQQNLINAQSIAVIRNNLGTMNDYIIETRDFLEQAVDKINRRLEHVENNTSFNSWSLHIEANKRRFTSIPGNLLVLHLTYDFMRSHRDVVLTSRDINYLVVTLEKLKVNCDQDVQLLGFIIELIEQIEITGIERYREMIELAFDGHVVDSHFIQGNISGIGFNALYFLSEHYEKILDLTEESEFCRSDEDREKIVSKFFGNEFSGLSTTYSIRDLIGEVIGGSTLAIDIYKDMNGLNVIPYEFDDVEHPESVSLISSLSDIQVHTFLDNADSDEARRNYLRLFALCIDNSAALNKPGQEFLALLAEKAGCPELFGEIAGLADSPHKSHEYMPVMQALLDDEDKKCTWLLDAFFLLTLAQKAIENPKIKVILGTLKPAQLKEFLPNMMMIVNGSDESQVLEAAIRLTGHTQGWMNVIRYRELRFDRCFAEAIKQLNSAGWNVARLNLEMSTVYTKGMEHAVFVSFTDGSFLSNMTDKAGAALCTQGRKSALSSLNELRKKAGVCISENRSALSKANSLISRWNIPIFEFKDVSHYSDFDLDSSADNEDWGDQFERYYRQIENTLDEFSRACDGASEQLGFFTNGNFDLSVLRLREQKRAEYLRQNQLKTLEKQSVVIVKDGKEHLFSIEWQKIENPPCDSDEISHIKTDGMIWLIVANINSNEVFYRSEDSVHWQQVQLDTLDIKICFKEIYVVNGVWIITNNELREGTREEGFYYSSDALTWRHSCAPESSENKGRSLNTGRLSYKSIIYFNGLWLWKVTQYQKYSYIEKGFFSDSTKSDSYSKMILFSSKTLDGPWERWDQTPKFPEGIEVQEICSLPGRDALLASCEFDRSYIRNKKKPETPPFVMFYGAAKAWQNCTWGGSVNFRQSSNPPIFANLGDRLMHVSSSEILTSDKGYDWSKQETTLYADEYFPLKDLSLFTQNDRSVIYVSQDAKLFKEITLDEGVWRHLTANEDGILGVYYANKHEETVLRLGRFICQVKY